MAWWKKFFCIILKIQQNLNFLFLSHCVYLFKNWPSQFLSHLESVLYWGAQFSSLQKPKQMPDIQFGAGKFKFCCMLRIVHKCFFHRATFTCILKRFYFLIFSINVNDIKYLVKKCNCDYRKNSTPMCRHISPNSVSVQENADRRQTQWEQSHFEVEFSSCQNIFKCLMSQKTEIIQ